MYVVLILYGVTGTKLAEQAVKVSTPHEYLLGHPNILTGTVAKNLSIGELGESRNKLVYYRNSTIMLRNSAAKHFRKFKKAFRNRL